MMDMQAGISGVAGALGNAKSPKRRHPQVTYKYLTLRRGDSSSNSYLSTNRSDSDQTSFDPDSPESLFRARYFQD